MPEFREFPKLPRLRREIIVSEKIDGTNAAVGVTDAGEVYAQSRNRIITPASDNFGFAKWVESFAPFLRDVLGPGLHFGEWWGPGIQRGYGLKSKRFSLFNSDRWTDPIRHNGDAALVGLDVVPVLYRGAFKEYEIDLTLTHLEVNGSVASPGFMRPEGVVVWHTAANVGFKITLENDETPKSQVRNG